VYRNAVAMSLLQIGELVTHLTDDFKTQYNDIAWKDIKAVRNIAAHDYENFDLEIIWKTITIDIPKLRTQCREIIEQLQNQT
jgi:uncharacterized protein with HEPN domain